MKLLKFELTVVIVFTWRGNLFVELKRGLGTKLSMPKAVGITEFGVPFVLQSFTKLFETNLKCRVK